jgi:hypothetical protein
MAWNRHTNAPEDGMAVVDCETEGGLKSNDRHGH